MTEAQRAQQAEPSATGGSDSTDRVEPARSVQVGDRSWTVIDLPDGESWDVHRGTRSTGLGARIARVAVSDRGYFSTDARGTVRGPYVTLDEAVYPIGLDDPELLSGDVVSEG